VIIFSTVQNIFFKKVTKLKLKKKPKPVQTDRFRFGSAFLEQKPVQTGLVRFFPVWLGFFGLARFWLGFSGLARFCSGFFLVWVRFGLVFLVSGLKTEPNRSVFSKF
jgi:hypothetical protein